MHPCLLHYLCFGCHLNQFRPSRPERQCDRPIVRI